MENVVSKMTDGGLLTPATAERGNALLSEGQSLEHAVLAADGVSEEALLRFLATTFDVPYVDLEKNPPAKEILTGFPAAFVGAFFTGSILIETLFSLDGLGLLSYESVIRRDYPVVLGSLFFFTIIGLVATLLRDLSYLWVDPRVKYFG